MTTATGTYRNKKIYLDKKLGIKNDKKVKISILNDSWIDKYFGIMKDKFKGSLVSFVRKLRKPRY